jgi:transporter family-2 protein
LIDNNIRQTASSTLSQGYGEEMTRFWLLALLALIAGICIPTQAGINSQLSVWTRSPVMAATISFAVGTLVLITYIILLRLPFPEFATASGRPWWIWTGGALGAFFVATSIYLAPRLGATTMLAWFLVGQFSAALLLDHYGWLGFAQQQVSMTRIIGIVLIAAGALLVRVA